MEAVALLAAWVLEMRVVGGPEAEPCELGLHPWSTAKLCNIANQSES